MLEAFANALLMGGVYIMLRPLVIVLYIKYAPISWDKNYRKVKLKDKFDQWRVYTLPNDMADIVENSPCTYPDGIKISHVGGDVYSVTKPHDVWLIDEGLLTIGDTFETPVYVRMVVSIVKNGDGYIIHTAIVKGIHDEV